MSTEEKDLLKVCREKIEETLNWGKSTDWSNQDFEELSDQIFEKTQVKLSITTLKRIWGKVKYENSFNAATLNALAQYAGFGNWRTLRQNYPAATIEARASIKEEIQTERKENSGKNVNSRKNLWKKIIGVTLLLFALFFFIPKKITKKKVEVDREKIIFHSKKSSDDLPNSVVFTYDVSSLPIDTVIIQQNWDATRREKVSAKKSQHSSIYYYPGNFNARLIMDNEVLKTDRIYIKTKGWKGIVEQKPVPVYLHPQEIHWKGTMGVSRETLAKKINSTVFNNVWVDFYNVKEFEGLKANHFNFEVELRNSSSVEEAVCRKVKINIFYDGGAFIIPLSDKGCISDIELLTGIEFISGKDHDLSNFGCDFMDYQKIKCTVFENRLNIFLNDVLIFSSQGKFSEKEIIGLNISFEGTGEIKNLKLGEPGRFPIYAEVF